MSDTDMRFRVPPVPMAIVGDPAAMYREGFMYAHDNRYRIIEENGTVYVATPMVTDSRIPLQW